MAVRKKQSKAQGSDAKLIESLVYGLKETVEHEIVSRDKMGKLIEAEIFNLRVVQKDLVGKFGEIDQRVASMIDFLNTFPDRVGKAVTAALQGRGWGDPLPLQPDIDGIEFMKAGEIRVRGKKEISVTPQQGQRPPGNFRAPIGLSVKLRTPKDPQIRPARPSQS